MPRVRVSGTKPLPLSKTQAVGHSLGKCINIRAVVTYAFMAELVIAVIFFAHEVRTVYHLTFMRVYISFIGFWILFIVSEFVMVHACIIIWNKDGTENGGNK